MDADWSVEAAEDDPVMVVPWAAASGESQGYVDLKADAGRIDELSEAKAWPEVRRALKCLNAAGSGVWTAKCDAWVLDEEERQLDFGPAAFGFGLYVDVLSSSSVTFPSLAEQRELVETLVKAAGPLPPGDARVDFVLRPAWWNGQAGFGTTVYVFGYGEQEAVARRNWADAVDAAVELVVTAQRPDSGRYNEAVGE